MKKIALLCTIAFFVTGCGTFKTNQALLTDVKPVPSDRLYAFQDQVQGTVPVEVFRDTGALGSACYMAFGTKEKMIARLDTGEVARFYLTPGEHELSIYPDPMGSGLCVGGRLATPVVEKYQVKDSGVTRFRLSSRLFRRPELEDY